MCQGLPHQSIHNVDEPEVVTPHAPVELTADVVVVGGGSGLVAGGQGGPGGKKVILVEKAKVLGGNTDYAHAFFPVYTKCTRRPVCPMSGSRPSTII